jgi:hypothetical protein
MFYFIRLINYLQNGLYIFTFLVTLAGASEICEMKINKCPETYNNSTIVVPEKVISLSGKYYVCKPENVVKEEKSDPPSIMFVIDHSGSMSGVNGVSRDPTDVTGSRFKVSKAVIDTLMKKVPKAEIGLVLFQNALFFDTKNEPNAVPLPDDYPRPAGITTQAYIPLLRLDSTYVNGERGVDILKRLLSTYDTLIEGTNSQTTDLKYKPTFTTDYNTNINTAFDAAKLAMLKAKNPKKNQFIIFLSDGEPMPDSSGPLFHGGKNRNDFQNGTDVPTTFTVYFVKAFGRVPQSIITMTKNIASNNYSTSNPLSDYWRLETNYDTLLNVLNRQTSSILQVLKAAPSKLVINDVVYNKYNDTDSTFTINKIMLNPSETPITMSLNFQIKNESTSEVVDSSINVSFKILRSDSLPMSEGIELTCRDTIFYDVSVSAIKQTASEKKLEEGTFEFKRNNSDHGDLTVYFTIQGTAAAGVDYKAIEDSVTFTGNKTAIQKQIAPIADSIKEGSESVIITILSEKINRTIHYNTGNPKIAQIDILDDYTEPQVSVVVIKKNASEKNLEESIVEFRRSHSDYGNITIYFSVSGTAVMGSDYQSIMDSIVFTDQQTAIQKKIVPISDTVKEDTETVIFQILAQKENRTVRYVLGGSDRVETIIEDYFPDIPDTFSLVILPNPFSFYTDATYTPNVKKIFRNIITDQQPRGALIAITSARGLLPISEGSDKYGTAAVYDAVGNLVQVLDIKKANSADTTHFGFIWDGKNLKRRNVGSGMYLADIKVISTTKLEKRFLKKIGVK